MKYTRQRLSLECTVKKNRKNNLYISEPSLSNRVQVNNSRVEPLVLHLYVLILTVYNGENRRIRNY